MDERIKAIRKALGLTQQEFADRLGIQRSTIAQYETGRNNPIDAVVSLICREYNVDEVWLRTGEGEMFRPRTREDDIAAFFGQVLGGRCTDFQRRMVSVLSRLSAAEWELLESKMKELAEDEKGAGN
jgi:transcriptional regulator with XRE-family HTH domain